MNPLVHLLSHQPFLDRVAHEISLKAEGRILETLDGREETHGRVNSFRMLGSPLFTAEGFDGTGNTCVLPFSGRAEVAGSGEELNGDGWLLFEGITEFSGYLDIAWPADVPVGTAADFAAICPDIRFQVVLESIGGEVASTRPQCPAPVGHQTVLSH